MRSAAELELILKARNLASREVDKLHGSLGRIKGAGSSAAHGLATVGKAALGLAAGGLAVLVGGLIGATHAAAEEQKGIIRMGAALKANAKDYKGSTAEIEKAIAKRETLGFADDDLRESITRLVRKTHDSRKALALQATAMDVARLKGLSVADASDLVTKAMAGNKKVLADLGIALPKTATAQERLTAVQKVAAGQAEKYGASGAAAQEAFGIALGDLAEDIGTGLLPVMQKAFTWLRTDGIPAVRAGIDAAGKFATSIYNAAKPFLDKLIPAVQKAAAWVNEHLLPPIMKLIGAIWGDGKGPLPTALKFTAEKLVWFGEHAIAPAIGLVGDLIDVLVKAIGFYNDLLGLNKTERVNESITKKPTYSGGLYGGGRARGGMVLPGRTYSVGEESAETLRMGRNGVGMVIPGARRPGGAGGAPVVIRAEINGRTLFEIMDDRLYYALSRASRAGGRL